MQSYKVEETVEKVQDSNEIKDETKKKSTAENTKDEPSKVLEDINKVEEVEINFHTHLTLIIFQYNKD